MHYSFSATFKTRQILFYSSEQIISAFLSHTSRCASDTQNNSNKRAQNSHKLQQSIKSNIQYLWCIESCIDDDFDFDDEGGWWHDMAKMKGNKLLQANFMFCRPNQTNRRMYNVQLYYHIY